MNKPKKEHQSKTHYGEKLATTMIQQGVRARDRVKYEDHVRQIGDSCRQKDRGELALIIV